MGCFTSKGGQGPYLVPLHALPFRVQWEEYFDACSKSFALVAFDLPEHGKFEVISEADSFDGWAGII